MKLEDIGSKTKNSDQPYDDFYVVDCGIIHNALGVNSSLTVSALAFRIAEYMT